MLQLKEAVMDKESHLTHQFTFSNNIARLFMVVIILALLGGIGTGYYLSSTEGSNSGPNIPVISDTPKTASQDNQTFRDFAEGKIETKPASKNKEEYSEGTHLLIRDGAVPVALTSSVVDLSLFEGKKVKVFGETQKAIKEGWLMDVGKVEEQF